MTEKIMRDTQFLTYVRSHKGFSGQLSDDLLLDNPAYLASLLITEQKYCNSVQITEAFGGKKITGHECAMDGASVTGILV